MYLGGWWLILHSTDPLTCGGPAFATDYEDAAGAVTLVFGRVCVTTAKPTKSRIRTALICLSAPGTMALSGRRAPLCIPL